jgi:hypothetical protein
MSVRPSVPHEFPLLELTVGKQLDPTTPTVGTHFATLEPKGSHRCATIGPRITLEAKGRNDYVIRHWPLSRYIRELNTHVSKQQAMKLKLGFRKNVNVQIVRF